MTWAADLGRRVHAQRVARRLSIQSAARGAGIARDTWRKVEAGESVHDTKRATVLDFLGLDEHGQPVSSDAPPSYDETRPSPRLSEATLDELLDELAARRERPGGRLPDLGAGRASRRERLRAEAEPQERAAYDDDPD